MKNAVMLILFVSSCALASSSDALEYRADYDQSISRMTRMLNPDVQKILMQDVVGKSLMFLPITKIEVISAEEIEMFTEYCSRVIRIQQSRGGMSGRLPFNLVSISEGSCSGD